MKIFDTFEEMLASYLSARKVENPRNRAKAVIDAARKAWEAK